MNSRGRFFFRQTSIPVVRGGDWDWTRAPLPRRKAMKPKVSWPFFRAFYYFQYLALVPEVEPWSDPIRPGNLAVVVGPPPTDRPVRP